MFALLLVLAPLVGPPPAGGASLPELIPKSGRELRAEVEASKAPVTFVSAWSTWCGPCRAEMPMLLRVVKRFEKEGVRLVLVSADGPKQRKAAQEFLAKHGVRFSSFVKGGDDQELVTGLDPDWSGSLPAGFLYGPGGKRLASWEGEIDEKALESRLRKALSDVKKQRKGIDKK